MTRLVTALLVMLLVVPVSGMAELAVAQTNDDILIYDYNGDGEVFCDDFREEFPNTFTDEATEAMNRFPEQLSRLNNDPEDDNTACDGQPGGASDDPNPVDDPPSDLPPTPTPTPPPPTRTTTGCDSTLVENGRAVVCAGEYAEFLPFEGFEAFAARAQDGFGQFDGSEDGSVFVEVPQSTAPATGVTGTTSFQQTGGDTAGTQTLTGAQKAKKVKAKQKRKRDQDRKKGKRGKREDRDRSQGQNGARQD